MLASAAADVQITPVCTVMFIILIKPVLSRGSVFCLLRFCLLLVVRVPWTNAKYFGVVRALVLIKNVCGFKCFD